MSEDDQLQERVDKAVDRALNERMHLTINKVLDQRRSIDEETHRAHHEFIRFQIERSRRWQKRIDKIIESVGGWVVIAFLSGIGVAVYYWVIEHIKHTK